MRTCLIEPPQFNINLPEHNHTWLMVILFHLLFHFFPFLNNNILNTFVTIATTIKNTRWSNDFMYELILWPIRCPVNYEFRGQQVLSYVHNSWPLVWTIMQPNLPSPTLTEISVPIAFRLHSRTGKREHNRYIPLELNCKWYMCCDPKEMWFGSQKHHRRSATFLWTKY